MAKTRNFPTCTRLTYSRERRCATLPITQNIPSMPRVPALDALVFPLLAMEWGDSVMDVALTPREVGYPAFNYSCDTDELMGIHLLSVTVEPILGALLFFQVVLDMTESSPFELCQDQAQILRQGIAHLSEQCTIGGASRSYCCTDGKYVSLMEECMDIAKS